MARSKGTLSSGKRYNMAGSGTGARLGGKPQATGLRQLVICCLVSVLLLTFYIREGDAGPLHSVRGAASSITAPARIVGSVIAWPFSAVGNVVTNATASPKTLSELEQENQKLTAEVATLKEAQKTADRLQGLLNLKSTSNLTSTAARIIGGTGDAWTKAVTIDKGSKDGISSGMAVLSSGGVIGQVIEASATTSTVRLVTDESSGVSAMLQDSRAQGMLQGQADGSLRLSYVSADADVKEGDIIITSGIGGVFPKGLPLGTVSSVSKADNATYYTIVVRPVSTAESNEEVLVVTSLGSDQVATDEEVAAANASPQGTKSDQAAADSSSSDAAAESGDQASANASATQAQ